MNETEQRWLASCAAVQETRDKLYDLLKEERRLFRLVMKEKDFERSFTDTQIVIIDYCRRGYSIKETAHELNVSYNTVKQHRASILKRAHGPAFRGGSGGDFEAFVRGESLPKRRERDKKERDRRADRLRHTNFEVASKR